MNHSLLLLTSATILLVGCNKDKPHIDAPLEQATIDWYNSAATEGWEYRQIDGDLSSTSSAPEFNSGYVEHGSDCARKTCKTITDAEWRSISWPEIVSTEISYLPTVQYHATKGMADDETFDCFQVRFWGTSTDIGAMAYVTFSHVIVDPAGVAAHEEQFDHHDSFTADGTTFNDVLYSAREGYEVLLTQTGGCIAFRYPDDPNWWIAQ